MPTSAQKNIQISTDKSSARKLAQRLAENRRKAGYDKMSETEKFRYNQKSDAQELARQEKARIDTTNRIRYKD